MLLEGADLKTATERKEARLGLSEHFLFICPSALTEVLDSFKCMISNIAFDLINKESYKHC